MVQKTAIVVGKDFEYFAENTCEAAALNVAQRGETVGKLCPFGWVAGSVQVQSFP